MLWASLLACLGALYGAWSIFESYGLSPGDGGVLRPFGERLALALFVAALGLAFAGGMMLFASLYATSLRLADGRILIETLTPIGLGRRRHAFDLSEIGESAYHHGQIDLAPGQGAGYFRWVNAPWISLRVAGRRLPFIFDEQAETIDVVRLTLLSEGIMPKSEEETG